MLSYHNQFPTGVTLKAISSSLTERHLPALQRVVLILSEARITVAEICLWIRWAIYFSELGV